jgi:hypothetical protein
VHFTVDTTPPAITLLSPQNRTYDTTNLMLNFTLNETASWVGYSLDREEAVTINGNISLKDLPVGSHTLPVYANDTAGNTAASGTIYFTVPEPLPTAWTAVAAAVIAAGGVVFLFYRQRTHKAIKKVAR